MMETSDFKKLLYRVSYVIAAVLFFIGVITFNASCPDANNGIFGVSWIFLIIGMYFNAKSFLYNIKIK